MSRATRRMSSATHAPCDHDVTTGVKPSLAPGKGDNVYCNAGRFSEGRAALRFLRYGGTDLAAGEAGRDFFADFDRVGIFQEIAFGIEDQRVSAIEDGQW